MDLHARVDGFPRKPRHGRERDGKDRTLPSSEVAMVRIRANGGTTAEERLVAETVREKSSESSKVKTRSYEKSLPHTPMITVNAD